MLEKVLDWFFETEYNYMLNRKIFLTIFLVGIAVVLLVKAGRRTDFMSYTSKRIGDIKIEVDEKYKQEIKARQAHERAMAQLAMQREHKKSLGEQLNPQAIKDKLNPKRIIAKTRKNREKRQGRR